ncbi:uncharacterized protein UV8b_05880 [Ustilaginoidea virens]|uniref:Uncharacterized protein n=1 Tax=Ustilaginoidea virens TaxID=1159556 RepID=A0A8E5MJI0_USTVR|nr:uncharacterized protein UV8b_05880 [Ustilaginoidea virens]QUC21637.1 hypothetical protein UV8b_05880 [Ustilaginoidea virens]
MEAGILGALASSSDKTVTNPPLAPGTAVADRLRPPACPTTHLVQPPTRAPRRGGREPGIRRGEAPHPTAHACTS